MKKNKVINDLVVQSDMCLNTPDENLIFRAKENGLVMNLKIQFKDLKKQLNERDANLEAIKKKVKTTKINEILLEAQTYQEEIQKMRSKFEATLQRQKERDRACNCQENENAMIYKLNDQIQKLQDEITQLNLVKLNFEQAEL